MKDLPSLLILMKIFPRLPAKEVIRCKTVSKEWLAYLSTPEFAKNNCRFLRVLGDQKIIVLDKSSCAIRYVDVASPRCVLGNNIHIPFDCHPCNVIFLASLDGMVCVCLCNTGDLVVWNPLTHVFKMLRNSNYQGFYTMDDDSLGFCVDSAGDYKIMHIKCTHFRLTVNIYSFSEGSWSTPRFLIDSPYDIVIYSRSVGTFCRKSLYFVLTKFWCMGNTAVLRLDVESKVIENVGYPDTLSVESIGQLVTIRDELHMVVSIGMCSVDVQLWHLQNNTWSKVVSFVPRVFMPLMIGSSMHYIDGNNKLIIVHEWGDVAQINVRAKKMHVYLEDGNITNKTSNVAYRKTQLNL
ncbi:putative F-box protein At4g17780 [Helianthus annuus]|uniref:putative F-box protein At4g17780 n=1 Tax=Helianthus annuus TaxID=4232 RepID=UPI000B8FE09E|nr:putative F-box protein At4g17780 [Helianthus annuus]